MGLFSFIGSIFGGGGKKKAMDQAAKLQYDAAMAGVAETARQFDQTRADFAPAQALLAPAAGRLGDLTGINGDEALQEQINMILGGPRYKSLLNNGRDEMLATAAATGGLRGGNFQDASQRFGADVLSSEIQRQLGEYAGLVGIGTGAAGAVGNFGANAVAQQNTLRQQGAGAKAGAILGKAGINAQNWQNAGSSLDSLIGGIIKGPFKALF